MSQARVRNLFQTAVAQYATSKSLRVAYDNVQFTPTVSEIYLVCHLLPASTDTKSIGGDHKRFLGVFQITIVTPSGTATAKADEIASELQDIFTVYKRYTDYTGFTVIVMSPLNVPQGKVQNGGWIVPCYFNYRADTN